ncbi:hypothetical protein ABT297_03750 [Dactylosporangium sp. NPDC000555]|uniref:hypothetical protein n=1 Tax=Dactylosporangium sp. NPDC000555 TaxID=3154260 RepID=UPI00332AE7CB
MKRRWIVAAVVAWAVAVAGLALYSHFHGRPTAREQTTIAEALPTVDGALGRIYSALDPASSVAVIGGYRRTEMSCQVTTARKGTRFARDLTVYVKKSAEGATIDRVRAALPAQYKASVVHNAGTDLLSADAGNFVAVRGSVPEPGQLRFTADTGCRVQDAPVTEATPPAQDAGRAPVQAVLDTLGKPASEWRAHQLACPAGGTLRTVEAVTAGDGSAARATVPASAVVLDEPKVYAYRAGTADIALRTEHASLVVSSTAGC